MEEGQEGCCGARPSTHGETEYSVKVGAVARAHSMAGFFLGGGGLQGRMYGIIGWADVDAVNPNTQPNPYP